VRAEGVGCAPRASKKTIPARATPVAPPTCCTVESSPEAEEACRRSTAAGTTPNIGAYARPIAAPTKAVAGASRSTRARQELAAGGGESPRTRADAVVTRTNSPAQAALAVLTSQEAQIVRLAAQGPSNRDIAAQLVLSPRTVGHYLYRAYPKLGVASRGELPALLGTR